MARSVGGARAGEEDEKFAGMINAKRNAVVAGSVRVEARMYDLRFCRPSDSAGSKRVEMTGLCAKLLPYNGRSRR